MSPLEFEGLGTIVVAVESPGTVTFEIIGDDETVSFDLSAEQARDLAEQISKAADVAGKELAS